MKILYVTGMCAPIKDIFTGKTENEITHLAQFFHPWHKLVKKGHQVDFVVASNFNGNQNIKVDWFREDNIYVNIYDPYSEATWYRRVFRRIKRFIKLIYYTNKAISENDYDFVYGLAYYEGLAGNIVANIRGVPCGMRSMGTMIYYDFEKYGTFWTAIKRPVEFLVFKLKKEFFIMTDDGTKGDFVYEKWKPKREKYDFHFWKTGIDFKAVEEIQSQVMIPEHDYLFFAARFDRWKRHDRILKILHILHLRNNRIHLYFSGNITIKSCHDEVKHLVGEYGLDDYVHFLGPIKQDDVKVYSYNAVANPLMYDCSNLGNIFFEIFSTGSVVIGLNDGTLNDYLENEKNGFIVDDEDEASVIVERLLKDKILKEKIRKQAISNAKEKVLSIDDRFDKEVDLIEKIAASKRTQ
ncbi:MAG: glycosyltransferase involved in cell wall biosynthesis [Saprospiraceae bacterium]|jgi:glycosyltransferase involved in cell wall biosynthesis